MESFVGTGAARQDGLLAETLQEQEREVLGATDKRPTREENASVTSEKEGEVPLFKVVVLGDVGCGKTALVQRLLHNSFSSNYKATLGVDFRSWSPDFGRVQMWDLAGPERFGNMTRIYYQNASAAVIVYEPAREFTRDAVSKWLSDFRLKVQDSSRVLLVANKIDNLSSEDLVQIEQNMHLLADELEIPRSRTMLVSCKDDSTRERLASALTELLQTADRLCCDSFAKRPSIASVSLTDAPIPVDAPNTPNEPAVKESSLPETSEWQFLIWERLVEIAVRKHLGLPPSCKDDVPTVAVPESDLICDLPYVATASDEQMELLRQTAARTFKRTFVDLIQGKVGRPWGRVLEALVGSKTILHVTVTVTRISRPVGSPPSAEGPTWFHFARQEKQ